MLANFYVELSLSILSRKTLDGSDWWPAYWRYGWIQNQNWRLLQWAAPHKCSNHINPVMVSSPLLNHIKGRPQIIALVIIATFAKQFFGFDRSGLRIVVN